jgi:cellulose biosynthesis protein BcsQ
VLLIDLDPQGHLTEGVEMQDSYLNATRTLYDSLIGTDGEAPSRTILCYPLLLRLHAR